MCIVRITHQQQSFYFGYVMPKWVVEENGIKQLNTILAVKERATSFSQQWQKSKTEQHLHHLYPITMAKVQK